MLYQITFSLTPKCIMRMLLLPKKTTDISETEEGQGAILDALTQRNTQLVQEMSANLADLQGNSAGGQGTN